MAQINNCEFMVKGYHYTKPTDPSRIDSCRLYIDTDINGEESSVITGDYNWIKYKISGSVSEDSIVNFEGFLPANFWTSKESIYPKDLNGNNTTTIRFVVFYGHTLVSLDVGSLVSSGGRIWQDINITGPGTYSYTDPTLGTKYRFTLTEVSFGDKWIVPTSATVDSSISLGEHNRLELKGIHGFYAQT